MYYPINEENLAECKKLLLNPKFHKSRMATIKRAVASGSKSRNLFRNPQVLVLHCLVDYAETNYSAYKAFMDSVEKEYAKIQKVIDMQSEVEGVKRNRALRLASVHRVRHRRHLVRAILYLKSGAKKYPSKDELDAEMRKYQAQWSEAARKATALNTSGEDLRTVFSKAYDKITQELEAEVERLKKEHDEKSKLERENS